MSYVKPATQVNLGTGSVATNQAESLNLRFTNTELVAVALAVAVATG